MVKSKRIPAATVRRLWSDLNITTADAADQLGITRAGLSDMARRLGLPSRSGNYGSRKRGSDTEFAAMWAAGVAIADMAQHFGYASHRGVISRRKAMGLPPRTRGRGKGNGRGWAETITLDNYRQGELARRMAEAAAQTQARIIAEGRADFVTLQRGGKVVVRTRHAGGEGHV